MRNVLIRLLGGAAVLMGCGSCDIEVLLNQTASFGGVAAGAPVASGGRGVIRVLFENNTPFRALFTYGSYDNTDERNTPLFLQFSPDSQLTAPTGSATLEGNSSSVIHLLPCARVFSVGSRGLVGRIQKTPGQVDPRIDEAVLFDGVGFSDTPVVSDAAAEPNVGFAAGFEALLGVDFNCGSLVVVRLEFAEVGPLPFKTEMQVFPSEESAR